MNKAKTVDDNDAGSDAMNALRDEIYDEMDGKKKKSSGFGVQAMVADEKAESKEASPSSQATVAESISQKLGAVDYEVANNNAMPRAALHVQDQ